jgi:hypothetical protein
MNGEIEKQATPPDLAAMEAILTKALAVQKEMYTLGQGYNQVILAAGYAAFLTLWAKMASAMPRHVVLLSGALFGCSLFIFVAYHIAQMLSRALPVLAMGKKLHAASSTLEKLLAFEEYEAAALKNMAWAIKLWPFALILGVGLAATSAMMIIGSAFWGVIYSAKP